MQLFLVTSTLRPALSCAIELSSGRVILFRCAPASRPGKPQMMVAIKAPEVTRPMDSFLPCLVIASPCWRRLLSSYAQVHLINDIQKVSARIPQWFERLRPAHSTDGADHGSRLSGPRRLPRVRPLAKGVGAEILAQSRGLPRLSAIGRDQDFRDSVASVEGHSVQRHAMSQAHWSAVGRSRDHRLHDHAADWHRASSFRSRFDTPTRSVRDAIRGFYKKPVKLLVNHGDLGKVLDPISRVPSRHDQAG